MLRMVQMKQINTGRITMKRSDLEEVTKLLVRFFINYWKNEGFETFYNYQNILFKEESPEKLL